MNRRVHRNRFLAGLMWAGILAVLAPAASAQDSDLKWRNIVRKRLPNNVSAVALEYTVVLVKDGSERPVDPAEYKFALGDQFIVKIEPKDDMYIYIFTEGPTGERACLLPTTEEKPPFARTGQVIELPDDGSFQFDVPPGEEKLIVVATAEPSKDLAALANVVFRKPEELLTDTEKEEKARLKAQYEKRMQSTEKDKLAGAKTRGVLNDKTIEAFAAALKGKTRGTIEEPPHGAEKSTFAMGVSTGGNAKPELLINISLKSMLPASAQR